MSLESAPMGKTRTFLGLSVLGRGNRSQNNVRLVPSLSLTKSRVEDASYGQIQGVNIILGELGLPTSDIRAVMPELQTDIVPKVEA